MPPQPFQPKRCRIDARPEKNFARLPSDRKIERRLKEIIMVSVIVPVILVIMVILVVKIIGEYTKA